MELVLDTVLLLRAHGITSLIHLTLLIYSANNVTYTCLNCTNSTEVGCTLCDPSGAVEIRYLQPNAFDIEIGVCES